MNSENLTLALDRRTAEKLYSFLFESEETLDHELILLMDRMEKEFFGSYSIEKMKELTLGKEH